MVSILGSSISRRASGGCSGLDPYGLAEYVGNELEFAAFRRYSFNTGIRMTGPGSATLVNLMKISCRLRRLLLTMEQLDINCEFS